jgi:hypothetical protein
MEPTTAKGVPIRKRRGHVKLRPSGSSCIQQTAQASTAIGTRSGVTHELAKRYLFILKPLEDYPVPPFALSRDGAAQVR